MILSKKVNLFFSINGSQRLIRPKNSCYTSKPGKVLKQISLFSKSPSKISLYHANNRNAYNGIRYLSTTLNKETTPHTIMEGHTLADNILDDVALRAQAITRRIGRAPKLCVVLVGDRPDSQKYIRVKENAAKCMGIDTQVEVLPKESEMTDLLQTLYKLNTDPTIDGIIIQLPLPPHLNASAALQSVVPHKDVDGFHLNNQAHLLDADHVNTQAFTVFFGKKCDAECVASTNTNNMETTSVKDSNPIDSSPIDSSPIDLEKNSEHVPDSTLDTTSPNSTFTSNPSSNTTSNSTSDSLSDASDNAMSTPDTTSVDSSTDSDSDFNNLPHNENTNEEENKDLQKSNADSVSARIMVIKPMPKSETKTPPAPVPAPPLPLTLTPTPVLITPTPPTPPSPSLTPPKATPSPAPAPAPAPSPSLSTTNSLKDTHIALQKDLPTTVEPITSSLSPSSTNSNSNTPSTINKLTPLESSSTPSLPHPSHSGKYLPHMENKYHEQGGLLDPAFFSSVWSYLSFSKLNMTTLIPGAVTKAISSLDNPDHPNHDLSARKGNKMDDIDTSYYFDKPLSAPMLFPCTPLSCIALMDHYKVNLCGAHVVVLGRSTVVGFPLSLMLMHRGAVVTNLDRNATSSSRENLCRQADVIVTAVGKANLLTKNCVKPGAVVIDVGINFIQSHLVSSSPGPKIPPRRHDVTDKKSKATSSPSTNTTNPIDIKPGPNPNVMKLVGDADYFDLVDHVGMITPVPGGVGPVTVSMLLRNTVLACEYNTKHITNFKK